MSEQNKNYSADLVCENGEKITVSMDNTGTYIHISSGQLLKLNTDVAISISKAVLNLDQEKNP